MAFVRDTITLYKRDMLIFKANLRSNIVRSIIFPLVIILFFGSIGTTVIGTPVAIVNYANNHASTSLINSLESSSNLQIISITDQNTAMAMLRNGSVSVVIVILQDFPSYSQKSVDLYYSNAQQTVAGPTLQVIDGYIAKYTEMAQPAQQPGTGISANSLYATKGSYKDFLMSGIIGMVIIFGALFGGGLALITDIQLGYMKALFVSPIDKNAIMVSRILSGSTQALLYAFTAVAVGLLAGANIAMGFAAIPYIILIAILIAIGFQALTMLIVIVGKIRKPEIFAIISQTIGLPLWFISGGITPIYSLPSWLQAVSVVDPLTYANEIARDAILVGFINTQVLLIDGGILACFSAFLVALLLMIFKPTIE